MSDDICYRCGANRGDPLPKPEHPCDEGHAFNAPAPSAEGIVGEMRQVLKWLMFDYKVLANAHMSDDKGMVSVQENSIEMREQKLASLLSSHGDARYEEGKRDGKREAYRKFAKFIHDSTSFRAAAKEDGIALD
jgi:hypothetical protein